MTIKFENFNPVLGSSRHPGFLFINAILAVAFFAFAIQIAANVALGEAENWEVALVLFMLCGLCLFAFWEQKTDKVNIL